MQDNGTLHSEQIELLYDTKRIENDGDEPVVVSESAVSAVRDVLGEALESQGLRDPSTLSLESLARQFTDEDGEVDANALLDLSQHPETGGEDSETLAEEQDTDDEPEGIEALSSEQVEDVRDKLQHASMMEDRTPRYSEELRQQAVDMVPGVSDHGDIELDPSDH